MDDGVIPSEDGEFGKQAMVAAIAEYDALGNVGIDAVIGEVCDPTGLADKVRVSITTHDQYVALRYSELIQNLGVNFGVFQVLAIRQINPATSNCGNAECG